MIPPSEKYDNYLLVTPPISSKPHTFRRYPMQVLRNVLSVDSSFEQPKHLRYVALIFISRLEDTGDPNRVPDVVKDFIDPPKQLFILRREIHSVIPD